MSDTLLNKKVSIERCIRQIRSYYDLHREAPFERDHLRQDAIAMNLQRAIELCIDMANHLIRTRKLGLPQDSRDSFALLEHEGVISTDLADQLKRMVGFRNVLVHEYRKLDLEIMTDVIDHRLEDLLDFTVQILGAAGMRTQDPGS